MEKTYHSLKDFELSYGKNAIERANDFQQYIEQLNDFGCKSYWITSHTGIDRKSTRLNSSHRSQSRMPSSA